MVDTEALRAEIARLGPWHHDMEIAPGIRTGDETGSDDQSSELGKPSIIRPDLAVGRLFEALYPDGLGGRTILDCACNAGGYLFAAADHGAGRCFGFDVRQHWIDQARFLSGHLSSRDISFERLDLAELPSRNLGQFDITFFNGIFYHLPDPVAGLRIAADHTKELLIVNTAMLPGNRDALVLNPESTTLLMSGVHGLAWWPSSYRTMQVILEWCGFPYTRLSFDRRVPQGRRRMEVLAARRETVFEHYDLMRPRATPRPSAARRLLLNARALLRKLSSRG